MCLKILHNISRSLMDCRMFPAVPLLRNCGALHILMSGLRSVLHSEKTHLSTTASSLPAFTNIQWQFEVGMRMQLQYFAHSLL